MHGNKFRKRTYTFIVEYIPKVSGITTPGNYIPKNNFISFCVIKISKSRIEPWTFLTSCSSSDNELS